MSEGFRATVAQGQVGLQAQGAGGWQKWNEISQKLTG
jgi:hypothetical protein